MEDNPFINGIEIPVTVYKFRDWTNNYHKKILDGEIFFSSPLDFNDPFDCNISIDYSNLQNNHELQLKFFNSFVDRHNKNFTHQQKLAEVNRLITEGRFNDPVWIEWQAKTTRRQLGQDLGVFCLTRSKDNILLWSHYANSHRGFCVGFESKQLFYECLQQGIKGGDVVYSIEYPIINPLMDLFEQIINQTYIKSHFWFYEQEYRLSKLYSVGKIFHISKSCFKEITLGCEISNAHRQEIVEFFKNEFPKIPIYQAVTIRNKFELTFEQIE